MRRSAIVLTMCLCMAASYAVCESKDKDQKAYLAGVTERGRALFAYDQAAWHGTDAFLALHPDTKGLSRYICKKNPSGWICSFGKWNQAHDRFLVVYEASEAGKAGKYVARKYDPPKEVKGELPAMEQAVELATHDFGVQNRRFNTAVLPAPEGKLFVYIYPGQTKENFWPLGGDVRYTISADGKQIIEKHQLHKAIMDTEVKPDSKQPAGYHTHILSDVPEDTDVLYVLTRKPSMPEHVGTKAGVYEIGVDGSIVITNK